MATTLETDLIGQQGAMEDLEIALDREFRGAVLRNNGRPGSGWDPDPTDAPEPECPSGCVLVRVNSTNNSTEDEVCVFCGPGELGSEEFVCSVDRVSWAEVFGQQRSKFGQYMGK